VAEDLIGGHDIAVDHQLVPHVGRKHGDKAGNGVDNKIFVVLD
jgi:hypothetical protein